MRTLRGAEMPRLYAILDAEAIAARGADWMGVATELRRAGVRLLQLRDKLGSAEAVLARARALRAIFPAGECMLILNDRVEMVAGAGWDGVHLGQEDMTPAEARVRLGSHAVIGLSTHTTEQARAADRDDAVDYVAIGPVFATSSKRAAEPVVGVEGVRAARAATDKPLVAIGGIDEGTADGVLEAGADGVAMIGAVLRAAGAGADAVRTRWAHLL